jgi:hypothetical protein
MKDHEILEIYLSSMRDTDEEVSSKELGIEYLNLHIDHVGETVEENTQRARRNSVHHLLMGKGEVRTEKVYPESIH